MEKGFFGRQAEVLGGGLSEGLADVAQTTWRDLRRAGGSFVDRPVATTVEYLGNHWQDALAGAVIAYLNPRGAATAMLVGWSMRGLGKATFEAAREASRPGADLEGARAQLKEAVSHEGTAFLAAMPMAFAGSMVGRAGANAVFGRNMAASDLIRGRVTMSEVRTNLSNMRDTAHPPKVKAVITDLDGTTYPFSDYFAPFVRDVVPELARKTGMSHGEVYKALGEVMDARRTHDWPWVLEESRLAKRWPGTQEQFRTQVVEPYHAMMDAYRHKYLKAYPDVLETMAELKRRGIKIYALSDAPAFMAKARADGTGVSQYLDGLFALETPPISAAEVGSTFALEHGARRVADFKGAPSGLKRFVEVPKHAEKPATGGIEMIMALERGVGPKEFRFIGDSRVKDGGVAHAVGIPYIRARYGSVIPQEYEIVMATLRPDFGVAGPSAAKVYPPTLAEVASYADLIKFLEPKADYGAISRGVARSLAVPPRLKAALGYNLIPGQTERQ